MSNAISEWQNIEMRKCLIFYGLLKWKCLARQSHFVPIRYTEGKTEVNVTPGPMWKGYTQNNRLLSTPVTIVLA